MGLLTDVIRDKVRMHHDDEEKRRQQLRDFYHDRIAERISNLGSTGAQDDPILQQMTDQYLKQLNPDAKKTAQRGFDLVHKIKGAIVGNAPQQQEQGASPSAAPATSGAAPSSNTPTPASAAPLGADKPANPRGMAAPAAAVLDAAGSAVPAQPKAQAFREGPPPAPAEVPANDDEAAAPSATASAKQTFNQGPPPVVTSPTTTGPLNVYAGYGDVPAQKQAQALKLRAVSDKYWTDKAKEVGLTNPRDVALFVATGGQHLPPNYRPVVGTRKTVQFTMPDKSTLNLQQDSRTGQYYDLQGNEADLPDDAVPVVTGRAGYIRSVPHSVGLSDAKAQAAEGAKFLDKDGKEINLDKLPHDMGLQAMVEGDKLFYIPVTPNQKTITVGNQVYGVNPYQVQSIGTNPDVPNLGVNRTGSVNTPTQVVTDNSGTPHVLASTTTPNSPGARPRPAPAPAGAAGGRPPSPAPAGAGPGELKGIPVPAYMRQTQDVRPVRVGVAQLFGDPSNPSFKGLKDYAPIADDKGAQQRIGTAFNLVMKGIEENSSGHVKAGANGIGVDTGGLLNLLENWADAPNALAKSEQEQYRKVYAAMSPQEKEALNATFESLSTAVGARKLTGASPAQFATQALERDVPIIGRSAFSSDEFYDKLGRFAELIKNGADGTFTQVWKPGELERIRQLPTEMQNLKKKGPNKAPASKGGDLKSMSTEELLKKLK